MKALQVVNEASISVACLLDDIAVNKSSELNLSELKKDLEHIQDQITILENYFGKTKERKSESIPDRP